MRRLFALLFVLTLLPLSAHADVLPDGMHPINSCLRIDNLSDFPDYRFFLTSDYRFPTTTELTAEENCGLGGSSSLDAVKLTDYTHLNLPEKYAEDTAWTRWEQNKSFVLNSSLNLHFDRYVPDTDPAKSRGVVVHINAISDTAIDASITQDKKYNTDDVSQSRSKTSWPVSEILVACLGVLGLVLAYRAWKK